MLKNYKYYLENLDCANCAKKIEEAIAKDKHFTKVVVNFNTLTLTFSTDLKEPFSKIVNIVKKVEPDTLVYMEKKEENKKDYEVIRLVVAVCFLILSFIIPVKVIKEIFIICSYLLLLYKTVIKAFKKIIRSHNIDENALISISAIGAYILGSHMEGLMVLLLYVIGKILEEKAVNHSRESIKELLSLKVDTANLKVEDDIIEVKSEELKTGDIIVVKKGELIPVDGKIIEGSTSLDSSSLTGESTLIQKEVGDTVLSGSINKGNVILVEVTHEYVNSTIYKILELTMNATNNKAKVETKVSKIASYYTPFVLIIAIVISLFLPLISEVSFASSIYRALTFLVISCPCAIAISVPLSYFAGIGVGSKNKILVKGSNYLDEMTLCDTIIFDKTGTLTTGSFQIETVNIYAKNYSKKEVLYLMALGESYSNHPIAKIILNEVTEKLDKKKVKDFREIDGKGITYQVDGKSIKVGSSKFCNTDKVGNLFMCIDEVLVAEVILDDSIKDNAQEVISNLKNRNIKTIMFTGDNHSFAKIVADKTEIDEYQSELLPDEKYTKLKEIKKNHHVIFVGDGINDAPSLVEANVGISMGSVGSSSAIEASDIVIMNDDLNNIVKLIDIAKYTNHIINVNLLFAISVKILILVMAALGLATMWAAVFADTGVTLITILNSLRILKIKK